jgi:hypothetical protein
LLLQLSTQVKCFLWLLQLWATSTILLLLLPTCPLLLLLLYQLSQVLSLCHTLTRGFKNKVSSATFLHNFKLIHQAPKPQAVTESALHTKKDKDFNHAGTQR